VRAAAQTQCPPADLVCVVGAAGQLRGKSTCGTLPSKAADPFYTKSIKQLIIKHPRKTPDYTACACRTSAVLCHP